MNCKILYLPFLVSIAASLLLFFNGCIQTSYTYGVEGNPAISADGKYMAVLVVESKGISKQVNGGYRSTDYKSSYWLKLYETATGKFVKKKKIIAGAEEKNMLVTCYGGYADKIWLHTTGLIAYDINSLEQVVNEEKLVKQNNFSKNNFPDDQRSIDEMVADGYIRFRAINGDKYRIDLTNLTIQSEKEVPENATEKKNRQLRSQMSLRLTYGVRSDTIGSNIFILAKDSTTAINSHPGNTNDEPLYNRLYLFTANYTISSLGSHRFYRNSNLKKLSNQSYLNGIFLKDFNTNKIVRLQKQAAYIILHNDSLNNNTRSILTAIDESNHTMWLINTGLSTKLNNCIVKGKYCILAGNKDYLIGPHLGSDMLCIVNTVTGKMMIPYIKE